MNKTFGLEFFSELKQAFGEVLSEIFKAMMNDPERRTRTMNITYTKTLDDYRAEGRAVGRVCFWRSGQTADTA